MKRFAPHVPDAPDVSHSFGRELLVRVALVLAVPFTLWVLADPAAALLTMVGFGLLSLLVVGVVDGEDDGDCDC
jgi:hypothetical protein